ncbi:MAG: MFS transporter [bacterium]
MGSQKNIKLLAWFNFFTDFKLYGGIAIIYFSSITHSLALGMSIFSIANIADAIFEVPTGILSDRVGRKKTIILGALASILYSICFALGRSFWMLALGAVFQGLSVAFYSGNNDAFLHDSLTECGKEKQYHEFLGKLSSLFQLALAIGTVLGSILASSSFALVMWLSVLSQIMCFFISLWMIEPHIHVKKSTNIYEHMKEALQLFKTNKKLRLVSIAGIISSSIGEATFQMQAAFYNTLWPLWAVGIAKMVSYIGAMISFYFSGPFINKFKEIKVILIGNIYSRIINSLAVLFPTQASPLLYSSTSIFFGSLTVAKNSLLQKEFTPHQRATISSLNSLAESLCFAFFAYILGAIGDHIGSAKALFVAQLFSLMGTYLYWKVFLHEKSSII